MGRGEINSEGRKLVGGYEGGRYSGGEGWIAFEGEKMQLG